MIHVVTLAPIPLYYNSAGRTLNELEKTVLNSLEDYPLEYPYNNNISTSKKILEHEDLKQLKKFCMEQLNIYTESVLQLNHKFKITNSWSTRNPTGTKHSQHTHPNSIFSGVYYAECQSGSINFTFPTQFSKDFNFFYNFNSRNVYNSDSWSLDVKTGDVVIFPSWVSHFTTDNEHTQDRRIVGFNCFLDGEVGNDYCVNQLSITTNPV